MHELGHAAAAVWRVDEDVEVTVGSAGRLADLRLGRVDVALNAWSSGATSGSAAVTSSRVTAVDALIIALAGPAASAAGTVAAAVLLTAGPEAGLLHDLLWTATLCGALATVVNLVPFVLEDRDGRHPTDGALALEALRAARALPHPDRRQASSRAVLGLRWPFALVLLAVVAVVVALGSPTLLLTLVLVFGLAATASPKR